MPIPEPRNSESEDDFIARCMADDTMVGEYEPAQRRAICQRQWDERKAMADVGRKSATLRDVKLDGDGAGTFEAVFATMEVWDSDEDWTERGAFGRQNVVISQWNHGSWMTGTAGLPVGIGTIFERGKDAVVQGSFDLDDQDGVKTYHKFQYLHQNGRNVEFSYALPHVESSYGERDGREGRILHKIEVPEVSPVLMGAGVNTRLLAVKQREGAMATQTDEQTTDGDGGKDEPKRFVEQLDETVETVERAISRAAKVSALAHKDDRRISPRSLRRMRVLSDALHEAVGELDGLLDTPDSEETDGDDPNAELEKLAAEYEEKHNGTETTG